MGNKGAKQVEDKTKQSAKNSTENTLNEKIGENVVAEKVENETPTAPKSEACICENCKCEQCNCGHQEGSEGNKESDSVDKVIEEAEKKLADLKVEESTQKEVNGILNEEKLESVVDETKMVPVEVQKEVDTEIKAL